MDKKIHTEKGLQNAQGIRYPVFKRLFPLKEAAIYLGRSVYSMRELVWAGEIPVVKVENARKIYLDIADLDHFIDKNKKVYH